MDFKKGIAYVGLCDVVGGRRKWQHSTPAHRLAK